MTLWVHFLFKACLFQNSMFTNLRRRKTLQNLERVGFFNGVLVRTFSPEVPKKLAETSSSYFSSCGGSSQFYCRMDLKPISSLTVWSILNSSFSAEKHQLKFKFKFPKSIFQINYINIFHAAEEWVYYVHLKNMFT